MAAFSDQAFKAMAIPMVMAAIGIICSIIGTFFVRTDEQADQRTLLKALSRGTNLSAILIAIIACPLVILLLGKEHLGLYFAILAGLIAGVLIGKATEYYTSDTFKPAAISGRTPTTMNSLMPSMKLSEISTITGRLKNRSFATSLFAIHFSSIAPRTPHALPNSHCH